MAGLWCIHTLIIWKHLSIKLQNFIYKFYTLSAFSFILCTRFKPTSLENNKLYGRRHVSPPIYICLTCAVRWITLLLHEARFVHVFGKCICLVVSRHKYTSWQIGLYASLIPFAQISPSSRTIYSLERVTYLFISQRMVLYSRKLMKSQFSPGKPYIAI